MTEVTILHSIALKVKVFEPIPSKNYLKIVFSELYCLVLMMNMAGISLLKLCLSNHYAFVIYSKMLTYT